MNKILFLAPSNSIHAKKWIESQITDELQIIWYSFYKKTYEIDKRIKYNEFKSNSLLQIIKSLFIFLNKIKEDDPKLIHCHYLGINLIPLFLLSSKRLIYTSPWGSDVKLVNPKSFKGFLLKIIFNKSKIITVDAAFMYNEVSKFSNKNLYKIERINFGTDINFFKREINNISRIENNFKIISLRNLEDIYNLETLILAVNELINVNHYNNILVDIYGTGSKEKELKDLVNFYKLENYITFRGRYDYLSLPSILNNYNLYISTSLSDAGLSASTSEAMACELPVLLSDNSENPYWITNNSGFLFATNSFSSLSKNIIDIMKLPVLELEKIGQNGRNKILIENNILIEMGKINNLYQ